MERSRPIVLLPLALALIVLWAGCGRNKAAGADRLAATVAGGHTGEAAGAGTAATVTDPAAQSALMLAIRNGREDLVVRLLDAGTPATAPDDQWSALMLAAFLGHEAIVTALVGHGADVNTATGRGMTSLMHAASRGEASIARVLLAHGARIDDVDAGGHTALMFAANNGHRDVVAVLLGAGADPARHNRAGATAAALAAGNGYADILVPQPIGQPASLASRSVATPTLTEPVERQMYADAAAAAWQYVVKYTQPATGLIDATEGDPHTTVWDMGSSLGALYAAHELGLIDTPDYDRRVRLMLHTIRRLDLYDGAAFNKVYATKTGSMIGLDKHHSATGYGWSALDLGRLLLWLKVLAVNQPQYRDEATAIVGRLKMDRLVKDGYLQGETLYAAGPRRYEEGRVGYEQYAARGYAAWGVRAEHALSWHENGIPVTVMGHTLLADIRGGDRITSDPLILMGLELGWDDETAHLARELLATQQARYQQTGRVTIVGEDAMLEAPYFFYYYSALANGKDFALDVQDPRGAVEHPRWVSAKAAWAWHALLPGAYTEVALRAVAPARTAGGWGSGVYEGTGRPTGAMNVNTESAILVAALVHARHAPLVRLNGEAR